MSDTSSYQSFIDYIEGAEASLDVELRDAVCNNEIEEARVVAGELRCLEKLRHQLRMYEREEEQNAIIQEQGTRQIR